MSQPTAEIHTIRPAEVSPREAHRLLSSIVAPRPIAWVSTLSPEGIPNLAPFSFFNAVAGSPPTVMIAISQRAGQPKDTLRNIEATGEWVINMVDEAHAAAMNQTAGDWAYETSEFELVGLEMLPSVSVKPPRVADVPASMEARLSQLVPVKDTSTVMVLGQVVCFHVRTDLLLPEGIVNTPQMGLIARLGGDSYTTFGKVFDLLRPKV